MKNINDVINDLPRETRARVSARAAELIGQEMALQHLRKARSLTQETLGLALGVGQDSISRLEKRSDMLISTLQSYIDAMGGSLKLIAEFPDGVVNLTSLGLTGMGEAAPPTGEANLNIRKTKARSKLQLAHVSD
jgi:DNA-binding XRE family transcriptional regulator